jgi:hypothetical protein
MATTTNYGWTTPDDTALVKDGAAAIRTLGTSVDTTTKALNPSTTLGDIEYRSSTPNTNTRLPLGTAGQVLKVNSGATAPEWATDATGMTNPMTTTGDTIYSSSGTTPARLGIGTAGQVLKVNSGATAPEWGAPPSAGANWSLLNSGGTSLSGSTTTVSGISGADKIFILIENASTTNQYSTLYVRLNGDTANNYYQYGQKFSGALNYAANIFDPENLNDTGVRFATVGTSSTSLANGYFSLTGGNSSGVKMFTVAAGILTGGGDQTAGRNQGGYYNSSSVITSISLRTDSGTWDNGTVYVYTSA